MAVTEEGQELGLTRVSYGSHDGLDDCNLVGSSRDRQAVARWSSAVRGSYSAWSSLPACVIEDLDAVLFLRQEKTLKEIDSRGTMRAMHLITHRRGRSEDERDMPS